MAKDEEKEKSPDAWMRELAYSSAIKKKIRPWVYIAQIHAESTWDPEARTNIEGKLPEEQAYGLTQIVPKYHPDTFLLKNADGTFATDEKGQRIPDLKKLFDPNVVLPYSAGEMQRLVNKDEYDHLSEVEKNWFALGDYGVGEQPQGTAHDQGVAYARDVFRNRDAMKQQYGHEIEIPEPEYSEDWRTNWKELQDPMVDAELERALVPFADQIQYHLRDTPQTYTIQGPRGEDTETEDDDFPGDTPWSIWNTPWLQRYLEKWGWVGGEGGLTFEQWMRDNNIDPKNLQPGEVLEFKTPYRQTRG